MKSIRMFTLASCPYCQAAWRWVEELQREYAELRALKIERIDERVDPDTADLYDYYYVPTFFVDSIKAHEGAADKAKIEKVLRSAL